MRLLGARKNTPFDDIGASHRPAPNRMQSSAYGLIREQANFPIASNCPNHYFGAVINQAISAKEIEGSGA
jgi:hypothetical protein